MRPRPDDPIYATEYVRSLMARQLPRMASESVELLARGWNCDVFMIGDEHVLRLARNPAAAQALTREAELLPQLRARLPLAIPEPVALGSVGGAHDLAFALYRFLPGTPLCALELESDDYDLLAPAMGAFLAALHALPRDLAVAGDTLERFDASARSERAVAVLEQLQWEGGLSRTQHHRLQAMVAEAGDHTLSSARVLVHADLHPCNLLVDEDGLCAMIDWTDVHRGHPAADLATAFLSFPEGSRGALFAAYGRVDASTLTWARWRAITMLTATVTGAQARGDGSLAHRSVAQLVHLARG